MQILAICGEKSFSLLLADKASRFALEKQKLNLSKSIAFGIEQQDDVRRLLCYGNCKVIEGLERKSSALISEAAPLKIQSAAGEDLTLCFRFGSTLPSIQKLLLPISQVVSIGSSENDTISCKYFNFIKPHHAELFFKDGWRVKSNYTVCVNGKQTNNARLHFGDVIFICGLTIAYFGKIIAVSNCFEKFCASPLLKKYNTRINPYAAPPQQTAQKSFSRSARKIPAIASAEIEIDPPPQLNDEKNKSLAEVVARPLTMAVPMILGFIMMSISMASNGRSTMMSFGLITVVSSALLGAVWGLSGAKKARKEERQKDEERFNTYGNYLIGISQQLASLYGENHRALSQMYPPAADIVDYDETSPLLWNRNPAHDDFLFARLGTGCKEFSAKIKIPKDGYKAHRDIITDGAQLINREYTKIYNIPLGMDLRQNRLIGILSADGIGALRAVQLIVAQLASSVSYTDLKIALLNDGRNKRVWDYMRLLPHCRSGDYRYYSQNLQDVQEVSGELLQIFRRRSAAQETSFPHYLVIVSDAKLLEGNLLANYLLNPKDEYGVTTIVIAESKSRLPNNCRYTISCRNGYFFINDFMDSDRIATEICADEIRTAQLYTQAHRLANIKVEEQSHSQSLPSVLSFLLMFGASSVSRLNILSHWAQSDITRSMAVPIGQKDDGSLCMLDIHERFHGPHGLVAGTTGAGKSELLQSFILSLCVNFSPDDISFLIIDYKGGGMANLFNDLPHMAGQITNLSGNTIKRALISIKSEIQRRQRLFNEQMVNSINQYTLAFKEGRAKEAIPHLVIVVDEFAELKRNEPGFMKELISVAQVGRSLGVHLLLATQKPGGTVDDNIRSNSKFRLCLRVQDRQDSMDMLHRPDAAYITNPGRAYLQVGSDEIFEQFQSAYSGAAYMPGVGDEENFAVMIGSTMKNIGSPNAMQLKLLARQQNHRLAKLIELLKSDMPLEELFKKAQKESELQLNLPLLGELKKCLPAMVDEMSEEETLFRFCTIAAENGIKLPQYKPKSQLDAVIDEIVESAKKTMCNSAAALWLPPLPEKLPLKAVDSHSFGQFGSTFGGLEAPFALLDDPANQRQIPLSASFISGGNHAVIGSVGSGRSTLLFTILYSLISRYSPLQFNAYIADFSGGLLSSFRFAPQVGAFVGEHDGDTLARMIKLLENILEKRKKQLNGVSYAEYIRRGGQMPQILLVIDNYALFKERTEMEYESTIIRLSREGSACGMNLLVSGASFGVNDISARISENIKTVFALELADRFKYIDALHTTNIDILPQSGVKGRGLVRIGDSCMEFQVCLTDVEADEYTRCLNVAEECRRLGEIYKGETAQKVPQIPEDMSLEEFLSRNDVKKLCADGKLPLGFNKDTAQLSAIDFAQSFCLLAMYRSMQAKTAFIRQLVETAKAASSVTVIGAGNYPGAKAVKLEDLFDYFKELTPVFAQRNSKKRKLIDSGASMQQIADEMSRYQTQYIIIEDMELFLGCIYSEEGKSKKMNGFAENIFSKGSLHGIVFIAFVENEQAIRLNSYSAFKSFVSSKEGFCLDIAPGSQRLLDFGVQDFAASNKVPKRGEIAAVCKNDGETVTTRIVIPR